MSKVAEVREVARGGDLLDEATRLQQRIARVLDHAERTGDHGLFLKAARELREGLTLLARFQAFVAQREPPALPRPTTEIFAEIATFVDLAHERQRLAALLGITAPAGRSRCPR